MSGNSDREASGALAATVGAMVRQARADGLPLAGSDGSALTALLRCHGFDAPPLRTAAPPLARLLAELLTPSRTGHTRGRDDR
ncbi:MAG: hypothetical protein KDC18_09225 [Alphaproteobacteria bacterium]|nr:hypothetical protein [Alphaproteobacteria bacterium]MCB9928768.1 hypothetical protein [Alphaproteobacteria bacterium]